MAHLLILCEGDTEAEVLKPFLRPFWEIRFDKADVLHYGGNGELKRNFKADTELYLTQRQDSSVLCLMDLFNEPFNIYSSSSMSVAEGFEAVQRFMYAQITPTLRHRFAAYPVVMEIETWLLADPMIQTYLGQDIPNPETIAHPCGFLEQLYRLRNHKYKKKSDGKKLFDRASATRVYEDTCPHFNQLADWLKNAPPAPAPPANQEIAALVAAWERERDEKYQRFWELERAAQTDEELQAAIQAENVYLDFLKTYDDIYRSG